MPFTLRMKAKRKPPTNHRGPVNHLNDEQKVSILIYNRLDKTATQISLMLAIPESTVRSVIKSFNKYHSLNPKRGRPHIVRDPTPVISEVSANPFLSLRASAHHCNVPVKTVFSMRHEAGIHFYTTTPVPNLTPRHIQNRIQFCNEIASNFPTLPIIFTDESMIEVDLSHHGAWRKHGEHPAETFYPSDAHPVHVMVWGAIGPNGFRCLVQCPKSVNRETYWQMILEPIRKMRESFPGGFIFQQDNASPHKAVVQNLQQIVTILPWPPKSPDLSPIEQIWSLIKNQLRGKSYSSPKALFNAVEATWLNISDEMIHNYWSAFRARCIVCAQLQGKCLNGHWKEVTAVHESLT